MSNGPIDLTKLPAPKVIDDLSFETIFNGMRDDLITLDSSLADVLFLESEPIVKLLQISAMRELLLRQRINNSAKAVMIAYASDSDLDQLAALLKVERLVIAPANPGAIPPTLAIYESDDSFRARIQLALDGLSTAGPERAYIFHALSASGEVLDVSVDAPRFELHVPNSAAAAELPENAIVLIPTHTAGLTAPVPGDVAISVLSRFGNGTADEALIETVNTRVSDDGIRPMTDNVHVRSAEIINYSITATVYTLPGPDSDIVMQQAQISINAFVTEMRRVGRSVNLSGIYAALHVPGVHKVELSSPLSNVICNKSQAAHCESVVLNYGGINQ